MKTKLTWLLLLFFNVSPVFAQVAKKPVEQDAFRIIDSGMITVEAPFKNCHAATIVETGKDTLLYAWFGGDHEGAANVSIWGRFRYTNQEKQWSSLLLLAKGKDSSGPQPCWNPVLFKTRNGELYLDYKVGPNPREWWAERIISTDNGKTWSAPNRLSPPFLGPIKNKPVQLKDGVILFPSSTESKEDNKWLIHLERSDGSGNHWQYISINCGDFDVIQPVILCYGKDSLQMLCRSKQNKIVQTWSFDNGLSWSPLTALDLPNPNSGIDAVTLSNSRQLLVYNPLLSGKEWWTGRSVLRVAGSVNGTDWKDVALLENHTEGEYSYPAVIQDSRNIIRIAYTYKRTAIKFVDIRVLK